MSRRRSDDLRRVVQNEVQRQLGSLGLATKADLAALERRLTRANREAKKTERRRSRRSRRRPRRPAPKSASKAG